MVQRQEPSAGNDIPTKRERRKSSEAARTAFAREGAESAFAVTFRSMEIGQTSVADALGIVKRANSETVPERVKAVKGMRITFATLDNAPYNQNVADFLEGAASLIPSLRADLATEVIAGLGKAMQNRAYYDVARPAVEKLLQEPDRLTGNLKPCLEALRLMPAPRNHGSFDEDHPTPLDVPVTGPRAARTDGPPAVIPLPGPAPCPDGMIMEPGPITADPAAENTAWKKAWKGAAVAVGIIAIAGLGAFGISKLRHREPESKTPAAATSTAPAREPAPDALPKTPDTGTAATRDDGSAGSRERKIVVSKPKTRIARAKPAALLPPDAGTAAVPVSIARADAGVDLEAERIAAQLMNSTSLEETDSLFGLLGPVAAGNQDAGRRTTGSPDAGFALCQEACRISALKSVSLGNDDAKAVRAITQLAEFARYDTSQDAAHAVLDRLGENPVIRNSPKRLDALLMALQPARN